MSHVRNESESSWMGSQATCIRQYFFCSGRNSIDIGYEVPLT